MKNFQATEEELELLHPREQEMLRRSLNDETYEEIGRDFCLTKSRTGQIVRRAKERIIQARNGETMEMFQKLSREEQNDLLLRDLLGSRAVTRLRASSIDTVGGLVKFINEELGGDPKRLLVLRNFGRKSLQEVLDVLRELGRYHPARVE